MQCAYNQDNNCHALAITIGDGRSPDCDTFFGQAEKGGDGSGIAGVGACKVSACAHNQSLECTAGEISVGRNEDKVFCRTCTI
jgi:hypothetical protein